MKGRSYARLLPFMTAAVVATGCANSLPRATPPEPDGPGASGPLALGHKISGRIQAKGGSADHTFDMPAGTRFEVVFQSQSARYDDQLFTIYRLNPYSGERERVSDSAGLDGSDGPEARGPIQAVEAGTYLVEVRGGVGAYTLDAHTVTGTPLQLGNSVEGELPVERATRDHTFDVPAGTRFEVVFQSQSARYDDQLFTIYRLNPYSGERERVSDSAGLDGSDGPEARGPIQAEEAGTYLVEVRGGAGAYTLDAHAVAGTSLKQGRVSGIR